MQLLVSWGCTEGLRQKEGPIKVDKVVEISEEIRILSVVGEKEILPECIPNLASMPKSSGTIDFLLGDCVSIRTDETRCFG